jgi:CheY-like chemotaxis protein
MTDRTAGAQAVSPAVKPPLEASNMVSLPRTHRRIALACTVLTLGALAAPTWAQARPPSAAAPAAQPAAAAAPAEPIDPARQLDQSVENYWHYGKIARYDLAAASGQQILQMNSDPKAIKDAFEKVARQRKDNLEEWLLRWQGVEATSDVTTQLIKVIRAGYRQEREDPQRVQEQIERLNKGERAYRLAVDVLRESGELAVPMMVDYLRDPARNEYHSAIRHALRDMGRPALNPLLAATEMDDATTLLMIVSVLGDSGYDASVPYLGRLAQGEKVPPSVRTASGDALRRLGIDPSSVNTVSQFLDLAERFYYDNAAVRADTRDPDAKANIWFWDAQKGLQRIAVPPQVFNELMAMRSAEYALSLGESPEALALWLAANYKREAELPEGEQDSTRQADQPPAHFYGVTAGPRYLNMALSRALTDRNSAVALPVIRSLQNIVGQSNLLDESSAGPLVDAMSSNDRLVRFEGAFALAAAQPKKSFTGSDRVVPLLAEALGQTGKPSVLVVAASGEQANLLVEGLKAQGYEAVGAASPDAAVGAAASLPSVDVILAAEAIGAVEVDRLFAIASSSDSLQGVPRLVIIQSGASPLAQRSASDPLLHVTEANTPELLKGELDRVREAAALTPLDQAASAEYATRAAQLLSNLAMTGNTVYDLSAAEHRLLAALNDERLPVVQLAGQVLGLLPSSTAQTALLAAAGSDSAEDEVRVSLYTSLSISASRIGNQLSAADVATLQKTVAEEASADVRAAAAEAYGALNLPPDQAKALILKQHRVVTDANAEEGAAAQ